MSPQFVHMCRAHGSHQEKEYMWRSASTMRLLFTFKLLILYSCSAIFFKLKSTLQHQVTVFFPHYILTESALFFPVSLSRLGGGAEGKGG